MSDQYPAIAFVLMSSALVFLMTPGLALLYSGMVRSKNALSMIMLCFMCMSVITIQWIAFGYSISFSEANSPSIFIGNFAHAGLVGLGQESLSIAPTIPGILFVFFQLQFATVTAANIYGGVAERVRFVPSLLFAILWSTLVYDPSVYWTWYRSFYS